MRFIQYREGNLPLFCINDVAMVHPLPDSEEPLASVLKVTKLFTNKKDIAYCGGEKC